MSSGTGDTTAIRKKIGLFSILLIGLAIVSPLGPVTVYGPIQQMTGGHMALSFLIALIPMILVAYVYGIFAAEFPRAGGCYSYVTKSLHPNVGFITGWVLLLEYCLVPYMGAFMTSIYFCALFPSVSPLLIKIVFLLICLFLNLRTISALAKVNNIITACVAAVMLYFIIVGISMIGGGDAGAAPASTAFVNPATFSWSTIFQGAATACFAFLGFDALTVLAEDVNKPRKTLPKALILLCLIEAAFFIMASYVGQGLYPDVTAYTSVDSAMLDPMFVVGGNVLVTIVSIGMVVAMFAVMLDMMAASTRLLFAMGREGAIPKRPFGYESPKTHVPTYNAIILTVIYAVFCLTNMDLMLAITLITFGGLFGFVMVTFSAPRYFFFIKKDRKGVKVISNLIVPIIAFITSGYLWISLGATTLIVGFIWMAAGIVYLAVRTRGFRRSIAMFADEVDAALAEQEAAETQAAITPLCSK